MRDGLPVRRPRSIALAVCLLTVPFLLVTAGAPTGASATTGASARAAVRDATGVYIGTVTLRQTGRHTVQVSLKASRLSVGFHGFHIHAVGICDPKTTDPAGNPAPFLSAGPHFDLAGSGHGNHAGDLPALLVSRGGTASVTVESDRFTVTSLLDRDGSAIIIHASPDNLANIPTRYVSTTTGAPGPDAATLGTGDAGARTACGVVSRSS